MIFDNLLILLNLNRKRTISLTYPFFCLDVRVHYKQATCIYCSGTGFMYVKKIVDGKEIKAASKCKERCKATTNLRQEREPMPEELKTLLRAVGQKKPNRPDDMPINFRF